MAYDPEAGHRAEAEYRAAKRCSPGDPRWEAVVAECLAEVEADPMTAVIDANVAAAPPPEEWDPGLAARIRRMLREAERQDGP